MEVSSRHIVVCVAAVLTGLSRVAQADPVLQIELVPKLLEFRQTVTNATLDLNFVTNGSFSNSIVVLCSGCGEEGQYSAFSSPFPTRTGAIADTNTVFLDFSGNPPWTGVPSSQASFRIDPNTFQVSQVTDPHTFPGCSQITCDGFECRFTTCVLGVLGENDQFHLDFDVELSCSTETSLPCTLDLGELCGIKPGLRSCGLSGLGECIVEGNGAPETAYDSDNDCDGVYGECAAPQSAWECDSGAGCGLDFAACDEFGAGDCQHFTTAEVFDRYDNNCDGFRDECDPAGVWSCETESPTPGCEAGEALCNEFGASECVALAAEPETFNNEDDDCDGVRDNCNPPQQDWVCPTGVQTAGCELGLAVCNPQGVGECLPPNSSEIYNGEDDDCNGVPDDCRPPQTFWQCQTGSADPACATTQMACDADGSEFPCVIHETVNGQDDDCDMVVDECDQGEQFLACTSTDPACAGLPSYARCEAGVALQTACGCDNTCDGVDQDADGRVDDDPGPDGCLLRFAFQPICFEGDDAAFAQAASDVVGFFSTSLGLGSCSDRIAVDVFPPSLFNTADVCAQCVDNNDFVGLDALIERQDFWPADSTEYTAVGFLTDHDLCGTTEGFARPDLRSIWLQTDSAVVLSHEVGHLVGLNEEYCSGERGAMYPSCNRSTSVNPLEAALGCDPEEADCCSLDYRTAFTPDDPTPPAGGDVCGHALTGLPPVCCRGNRAVDAETGAADSALGRCIMSHITAEGPRGWCASCRAHWQSASNGLGIAVACESPAVGAGPLLISPYILRADGSLAIPGGPESVREQLQRAGFHHPGTEGRFHVQLFDSQGELLYERKLDLGEAFVDRPIPEPLTEAAFGLQVPLESADFGTPKVLLVFDGDVLTWQATLNGSAPVAVLDDQDLECQANGTASGLVDAVGTFDPDNDSIRFTWQGESLLALESDGPLAAVEASLGEHEISVEVTDGIFTTEATALLSVVDTMPPVIEGSTLLDVVVCEPNAAIALNVPEANDFCSPVTLTGRVIESNGQAVSTDVSSGVALLPPGIHVVEWTAEDDSGNVETLLQTVKVRPAVSTAGLLDLRDRARIIAPSGAPALAANRGGGQGPLTRVGVEARVGPLFSVPAIDVKDRAVLGGDLRSGGAITLGNNVVLGGGLFPFTSVSLPLLDGLTGVQFPAATQVVAVNPGPVVTLAPGAYKQITLNSGGVLAFSSGVYTIDNFVTNHGSTWRVGANTKVYVKSNLSFKASPVDASGALVPIVLGYAGTAPVVFEKRFLGELFAPNALITLGAGTELEFGARVEAKQLELRPDVVLQCFDGNGDGPSLPPPACNPSNVIANAGFETGTSPWIVWSGAALGTSSTFHHGGTKSGRVTNRTASWQGPTYNLLGAAEPGATYALEAWARTSAPSGAPLSLTLKVACAGVAVAYPHVDDATSSSGWTHLQGTFTVPSCALNELFLYIEGPPPGATLYVDDVSMLEVCQ